MVINLVVGNTQRNKILKYPYFYNFNTSDDFLSSSFRNLARLKKGKNRGQFLIEYDPDTLKYSYKL
jgi:hypothetical protein